MGRALRSASAPQPVSGATPGVPYSANETMERGSLVNGTALLQPVSSRTIYRDAEGRIRTEMLLPTLPSRTGQNAVAPGTLVEISDYVSGYQYTLEPGKQIVHRSQLRVISPRKNPASFIPQGAYVKVPVSNKSAYVPAGPGTTSVDSATPLLPTDGEKVAYESLGSKVVGDAMTAGLRWTVQVGGTSAAPMYLTTEVWTDAASKLAVLTKVTTTSSQTLTTLTNIKRSDSDVSLFKVPVGYSVIDETGPFVINYASQ